MNDRLLMVHSFLSTMGKVCCKPGKMKLQNKVALLLMLALVSSAVMFLRQNTLDLLWKSERQKQPLKNLIPQTLLHQNRTVNHQDFLETNMQFPSKTVNTQKNNSNETILYQNYNPEQPLTFSLKDDKTDYFTAADHGRCLREGTANTTATSCNCKSGWHGIACSIPEIVNEHEFLKPTKLSPRKGAPKRIIYGITFNIEFEMLEIRLEEMGDLIDVILILESNYTGFGEKKDLHLLNKMKKGFLKKFQQKILYLYLNYFPTNPVNPKDGSYTDAFMKSYLSKFGLTRVKGTRKDDIFIFADADEIHRREGLLFLKLHDGYPEPFGVKMRRNAYGFFWKSGENALGIGCSLSMLEDVYKNQCSELRGATSGDHRYTAQLNEYKEKGNYVQMWQIGSFKPSSLIGGWHCSWCFEPERIRVKLLSAFNYDFPRWGNFPEKTKLEYIRKLIKMGQWFDDSRRFTPVFIGLDAPYAPSYVFNNPVRYRYLLFNAYRPL